MNAKYEGVMSAVFSVYDESRNVKEDTVTEMVEYQLQNGLSGFYVGGNTGECTVLPNKTRKQMLEAVLRANRGRGTVIAHVGAGHIDDVYDLTDHAYEVGADAIASLSPALTSYYSMEETVTYYQRLAKRSKLPVFAYVTGILKGDLIAFAKEVAAIDNVIGIKMSVPDYYAFGQIKEALGEKILFNGPDETMICGLVEGADGAIGTSYNIAPKLAVGIYNAMRAGDAATALDKQRKLNRIISLAFGRNLAYWKALMGVLGFDMGYTVEPAKLPSEEDMRVLKEKLDGIGFFSWL